MDVPWEPEVRPSQAVSGGAAVLACWVPAPVRPHIAVTRWYKDGNVLMPLASETGIAVGKYSCLSYENLMLVLSCAPVPISYCRCALVRDE
ncbi:hypothetical protein EVAR_386_1 [Eumeta japonica]|uniref:Ig-like domain-containing protein n=1 Tax=Eumeta variegata TaxID=151549 RepID=A0A4C1S9W8_EUMVA|nr:hypothetical protein EVAR_386_1 [Eumeta japonica]